MSEKPKILILDGHTVNPGDISWGALEEVGRLEIYQTSSPQEFLEYIQSSRAEIVLTNKCGFSAELLRQCQNLRFIGLFATGYNNIDIEAAAAQGIVVANVPGYSTFAVAQMVVAMMLHFSNCVAHYSREVHQGAWSRSRAFCYWNHPLLELQGKQLGLVGFGAIAQRVARIAEALGMRLLSYSRTQKPGWPQVEFVPFVQLLETSDFISIHCPLVEQTRGLFGSESLAKIKGSAVLINTARGPIVDEAAVRSALEAGRLAGFAADVASQEPIPKDSPLLGAPNCVLTPHIAWAPKETRGRLISIVAQNVRSFLEGRPENRVC